MAVQKQTYNPYDRILPPQKMGPDTQEHLSSTDQATYDALSDSYKGRLAKSMRSTKEQFAASVHQQVGQPLDPNNEPGLNVTLEVLRDTWAAAFGSKWAHRNQMENDTLWRTGALRLIKAAHLEDLRDVLGEGSSGLWFRLKE